MEKAGDKAGAERLMVLLQQQAYNRAMGKGRLQAERACSCGTKENRINERLG